MIQPQGTTGTTITNNTINAPFRAIQGDVLGRPNNLTITDNVINAHFGVAGTEEVDGLTITGNTFNTSDEGIGLGEGVGITSISGNTFAGDGEHVRDYRTPFDPSDLQSILEDNDFDRAVVVRDNPIVVPAIFSSIQDAIDAAEDGHTVAVEPGLYQERVVINFDLVDFNAITLHSTEGHGAQIRGTSGAGRAINIARATPASDVTIDGFVFVAATTAAGIAINAQASAAGDGGGEIRLLNNRFEGPANADGQMAFNSDSTLDGVIAGNEFLARKGISVRSGNSMTVSGNTFSVAQQGIEILDDETAFSGARNLVISDNDFVDADVAIDIRANATLQNASAANNRIEVAVGVHNRSADTFQATCNWWGDSIGPSAAQIVEDDGTVDFEPWLIGETGPCEGLSDFVNPTTREDCMQGGWEDYGFDNQGLCIQFVNTGIDSREVQPIVTRIGGNVLWLDASALALDDEEPVAFWEDLSGNENHATQGSPGNQPMFADDEWNELPVVRFDGSSNYLTVPSILNPAEDNWTFFVVVRSATTDNQDIWQQLDDAGTGRVNVSIRTIDSMTQYSSFLGGDQRSSGFAAGAGSTDLVVQSWGSDTLRWFVGGSAGNTHSLTPEGTVGGYHIGVNKTAESNWLQGDIAEIIIYDRALSNAHRVAIESYLADKYGLN